MATSAAVPNANSSAPSSAATSRSRPVWSPPSERRTTRSRRSLRIRTWWTSASPSSHGAPTCLIEDSGEAPGPAGVPGQVDVRGPGLGHARRDRADAAPGDQLDPDPGTRVDRAQVGDELGQVLDRVDVVVRRRADVALARLAAPKGGDVGGGLASRQLAALARLGALGDLDLELVGPGQVGGRDAEARRGHLLDPGVVTAAVLIRACTRPDPRRPRRCSRPRRRAGCRSSGPGAPPG